MLDELRPETDLRSKATLMVRAWSRARHHRLLGALLGSLVFVAGVFASVSFFACPVTAATSPICPSVGINTAAASELGCNFAITIASNGAVSTQGNIQPGYDGTDDSLVGVVNNSGYTVGRCPSRRAMAPQSLALTATARAITTGSLLVTKVHCRIARSAALWRG